MIIPPYLKRGDKIAIVAPAKEITPNEVEWAKAFLSSNGFEVVFGKNLFNQWNRFSGTDAQRREDVQWALDNKDIKAILFARGGYGSVRIIDQLDFSTFQQRPKWVVGYSDISVFLQHVYRHFKIVSCHGPMPLNMTNQLKNEWAAQFLVNFLEGETINYSTPAHEFNQFGECVGPLLGGNLSVLCSLIGTNSMPDFKGSLLFIEDLCEELYHLDRMLFQLSKADILSKINGLIVGGFTNMTDISGWFNQDAYEIIKAHTSGLSIPVCFNFSAGHIPKNLSMAIGMEHRLNVSAYGSELKQKSLSE